MLEPASSDEKFLWDVKLLPETTNLSARADFEDPHDHYLDLAPGKNAGKTTSDAELRELWNSVKSDHRNFCRKNHPDRLVRLSEDKQKKGADAMAKANGAHEKATAAANFLLDAQLRLSHDKFGEGLRSKWREEHKRQNGRDPMEVAAENKVCFNSMKILLGSLVLLRD